MGKKTDAEIAREIYELVKQSSDKQKHLKSSTFWKRFDIKKRTNNLVEKTIRILNAQQLNIAVKSGAPLGEEKEDDWIILTLKLQPPYVPVIKVDQAQFPAPDWFQTMQTRVYESERNKRDRYNYYHGRDS